MTTSRWDRAALWSGAITALVWSVPLTVIGGAFTDGGAAQGWLWVGALVGFFLGGGVAAWSQQAGFPMSHALVACLGAYAVAQGVFVLARLARGLSINWFGVVFTGSAVAVVGSLAGLVAQRMRTRGVVPSGQRRAE